MNPAHYGLVTQTRSFLMRVNDYREKEQPLKEEYVEFANDILRLLPDEVSLNEVVSLRRYPDSLQAVPKLWKCKQLYTMQLLKPGASRSFCLLALALAMDAGVDLHGPRHQAIMLSLHSRVGAKSELRTLGSDILKLIANLSFC